MNRKQEYEALQIEREGYVQRGLTSRVKEVDAALQALGYGLDEIETTAVTPNAERAVIGRTKRKKASNG